MEPTRVQQKLRPVYDYIIVGAGSTGCVIANRLSEDANKTVLIVEAGGDDRSYPNIAIPGRCGSLGNTDCDWGFKLVSEKHAFKGYENQVYNSVCGKVLGGSGAINFQMYMRGTPHDYDTWKNMGCTGWGYEDVLPYFKKSEWCLVNELADSGFHGRSGEIMVSEAKASSLGDIFMEAGKEMGYKATDCNTDEPIGMMQAQSTVGDGIRQSSAECFLRPAQSRQNLHIATHCYVTKVLITHNVARGVLFVRQGHLETIRARREVILAAGAYCSPQILMLSGVGPKEHLENHGIRVHQDLPVGNNLQDHAAVIGLEFEIDQPLSVTSEILASKATLDLYEEQRAGPIASTGLEWTALIRTKHQSKEDPNPDVQLIGINGLIGTGKNGRPKNMAGIRKKVFDAIFEGNEGKYGFSVIVLNTSTKSRGTVRLASDDPLRQPVIQHHTLADRRDVTSIVEGIKTVMELVKTKPLKSVGARYTGRVLPDYHKAPFTDEYWAEYARTLTNTYHPSGTCKMGSMYDPTTVVDPKLRVKGVERLRVADASIMPTITSANLNATCVMIGEKAADLIRSASLLSRL